MGYRDECWEAGANHIRVELYDGPKEKIREILYCMLSMRCLSCGRIELTDKIRIRLFVCWLCIELELPEAEASNDTIRCN